ncbi:MAG: hypothetical protein VCF07_12900 [Nitrospinota bacterium]
MLTYRDRKRDRAVVQLYPNRATAETRAAGGIRLKKIRPGECRILPLAEAVA